MPPLSCTMLHKLRLHVWCTYAAWCCMVLHACCVYAPCMMRASYTYRLRAWGSGLRAQGSELGDVCQMHDAGACILHIPCYEVRCMYVACVLHVCCMRAAFMSHVCCIYVASSVASYVASYVASRQGARERLSRRRRIAPTRGAHSGAEL